MKSFHSKLKDKFAWDVTALPAYSDEQSSEFITDLVSSSNFLSMVNRQEGNKGSEEIKLLSSTLAVQDASSCGWNADGDIVYTDVALTTKRLKIQNEFCNEDLNGTWAQLMNRAGANVQDTEMPMEEVIRAYYIRKTQKAIQDLVFNGDTTSGDANLAHFDGLVKLWDADAGLVSVASDASITSANAFDKLVAVEAAIPSEVHEGGVNYAIICSRQTAQDCLTQIYNDKDYASSVEVDRSNGQISFILPTTGTRVTSYPQLSGDQVYAIVYDHIFYGTDIDGDENGYEAKYNENDEKLRFGVKFRSGINYVLPGTFVKLVTTLS